MVFCESKYGFDYGALRSIDRICFLDAPPGGSFRQVPTSWGYAVTSEPIYSAQIGSILELLVAAITYVTRIKSLG
jgi:hypothetical protein